MPPPSARDSRRPEEEGDAQPEEEKVEPSMFAGKTPPPPSVPPKAACLLLGSNSVPREARAKMDGAKGGGSAQAHIPLLVVYADTRIQGCCSRWLSHQTLVFRFSNVPRRSVLCAGKFGVEHATHVGCEGPVSRHNNSDKKRGSALSLALCLPVCLFVGLTVFLRQDHGRRRQGGG